MRKNTVIIGASERPSSYAYLAANNLLSNKHPIVLLSIHQGQIQGEEFINLQDKPEIENVDTVTLYINPLRQLEWEDYIVSLKPKRIIFNPGTENNSLERKANDANIETLQACTLVMLNTGQY